MSRPDPIEYAERLYSAMRTATFSPISFLAFGNAVKDGVPLRNLPRVAAEPFMRIVGEMLDLEEEMGEEEIIDTATVEQAPAPSPPAAHAIEAPSAVAQSAVAAPAPTTEPSPKVGAATPPNSERRRNGGRR